MIGRRSFLARLLAAPIVALAILKAPTLRPHTLGSFGDEPLVNGGSYDIDEMRRRYIDPAVRAMMETVAQREAEYYHRMFG